MNEPTNASIPQPAPTPGNKVVLDFVVADLRERAESGRVKYGTYLMTDNGRDALWDAYQEQLDFTMYLRQHLLEREGRSNHDSSRHLGPPKPPEPPKAQMTALGAAPDWFPSLETWFGIVILVGVLLCGFMAGIVVSGLS